MSAQLQDDFLFCQASDLQRAALMRVEGWILRHQAIASVSLHLPHKALAAIDASHLLTPTLSP